MYGDSFPFTRSTISGATRPSANHAVTMLPTCAASAQLRSSGVVSASGPVPYSGYVMLPLNRRSTRERGRSGQERVVLLRMGHGDPHPVTRERSHHDLVVHAVRRERAGRVT